MTGKNKSKEIGNQQQSWVWKIKDGRNTIKYFRGDTKYKLAEFL